MFEPQTDPSAGLGAIPYIPRPSRVSLAGSAGWPGSTQASRLPLALVSTISGVQPCDLPASRVSQNILVLTQPSRASSFWRLLLSQSVWLASSPKFRWWVPKQVSMNVYWFVFGSYTVTCREFCTNPSGVRVSGRTLAEGWPEAAAQYAGGFFGERCWAVQYTRP